MYESSKNWLLIKPIHSTVILTCSWLSHRHDVLLSSVCNPCTLGGNESQLTYQES